MSDIAPLGRPTPSTYAPSTRPARPPVAQPGVAQGRDQADFSSAAQMLSKLNSLPDVRQGLVDRVKGEIEAGTYETPEKLDAALRGLAEDIVA